MRETRSDATDDYIALVEVRATTAAGTTSVAGTLLGERLPRLVRINEYDVEAVLQGHMLFTRHDDRPELSAHSGAFSAGRISTSHGCRSEMPPGSLKRSR